MPMPKETNQSLQWTGGRPIMRRAVVTAKKVVMVNTGDYLSMEAEESLIILESPVHHISLPVCQVSGPIKECKG